MSRRWREVLTVVLALMWTCVAVPLTTGVAAPAAAAQAGTPFRCDSTYYVMRNDANQERAELGRVVFPAPGSSGASIDWFNSSPLRYNAIGYNHVDNYVYGIVAGSAEVVRLDADGGAENLGAPEQDGDEISGDRIYAGTFRADGAFLVEIEDTAYAVDVTTNPPSVVQDRRVSTGKRYEEWAVNPINDQIYTVDGDNLVRIDMTTPNEDDEAVVTYAGGDVPNNALDNLGAIWIDGNGRLTVLGGPDVASDFYQATFNPATGMYGPLNKIGTESSLSTAGDGANCAFRMGFEKTVAPATVTAGGNVTYTYDVTNGSGRQQVVTFTDDLTRPGAGGVFRPGTITTPNGTVSLQKNDRSLVISGLTVQSGQTVRITAGVTAPATADGVLRNQAQLSGGTLPGGEMVSDFPGTPDPADPTPLTVQPRNVDLAVSKSVGSGQTENLVRPGETFDYTITATNNGSDASWPATITDTVPSPLTPTGASNGGAVSGQTVTWNIDNLAAGASVTRTITVRVDADRAQTVVNTATVAPRGGGQDTDPGNDTSNVVTTNIEIPTPEADLRIAKSAPADADPGSALTYTIAVTNAGPGRSGNATVTDTLPNGFAVTSISDGGTRTGRTITWNLASLASGAQVTLTVAGTVPPTGGTLVNNATVTPAQDGPADPDTGNNSAQATTVVRAPASDLALGKEGPATVQAGQTGNYTLRVRNNGPDAATGAVVRDRLPTGFTLVAVPDGATFDGAVLTWTLGALADDAERSLSYQLVAPARGGEGTNSADVTPAPGSPPDPDTSNNSASVRTTVPVPQADLSITKTAPVNADPGTPLTYTIVVANAGPDRSGGSTVTDTLPDGFAVTAISDGGTENGRTVTWRLAPLPPDGSVTLTVTGTTPPGGGTLANRAVVTPDDDVPVDPDGGNNSAQTSTTVRPPSADLRLTKDGPVSLPAGQRGTFTLHVQNLGIDAVPGAIVRDTLPSGFTLVAVPGGAALDGDVLTWTIGPLANGAGRDLSYELTAPAEEGTGTNTATVTTADGGPPDPDGSNNTDSVTTAVAARADLAITKSGPPYVNAGEGFDWIIDVVDHGPSTARNVVVTDTVPAGFVVGTPTGPGTVLVTPNENGTTTVRWTVPALAPGASARFTIPVTAPNAAGRGDNSATVTSDTPDPDGEPPAPATNTVAVRGFTVAKTLRTPQGDVRVGSEVVYEIVATNASTVPYDEANGLATFTDDLSDVLDDATLVSVAPQDGVTSSDDGFTWSGPLAAGASRTVVVTVRVTGGGDGDLRNTVQGGTNCGPGSTARECSPGTTLVRSLSLEKTSSATVVSPGDEIRYTVTVENTGGYAFTPADPAVAADDLSGVLDDATFGEATATAGTVEPPTASAARLSWSGPLATGATVTIEYTVTVNDPQTGDGRIANTVSSVDDPDCLPDNGCGPEPALVQAFTLLKTVDRAQGEPVAPGDEVTYTVVATNTGQVAYDEAMFDEDLTGVLDDAELVAVAADTGTVSLGDGETVLRWSGPLPVADGPGATLTVTIRLRDPDLDGDHSLANVVTGSVNCPEDDAESRGECTAGVPLPVRGLTVAKAADVTAVHAGGAVTYTITVTNSGAVDYTEDEPAVLVDDMSAALDDGAYAGDATVDGGGAVTFADGKLTWTGPLAVDATATITYRITAAARGTGDHVMRNAVLAEDSNCVPSTSDSEPPAEACGGASDIAVAELEIAKTADVPTVRPGGRVTYTVTVHNIGAADYGTEPIGQATWTDDMTEVLDDARYLGDAQASAGAVGYAAPALTWSGPVAVGETATIRYSVEVNDPANGDKTLLNTVTGPDSACPCPARTTVDPSAPDPDLAYTGSSVVWYAVVGIALLAAGGAFFLLPALRRRRNREEG